MRTQDFCGAQVSAIGLGSAHFGGKYSESLSRELMDAYRSIGGNFIDTARVYGDFVTPRDGMSERVIGRWMADRGCRQEIFLSTKGGHPLLQDMRTSRLSREEIRADMSASLDALQTDHVEIYWLHRDDPERPVGEIVESLQGLIEDGSALRTGVSNWRPERILEANAYAVSHGLTPLAANQVQFSLARQVYSGDPTLVTMDRAGWRMHRETGMVCCYGSLAQGFFTRLEQGGEAALSPNARKEYLDAENLAVAERVRRLEAETGLSALSIAVGYLTSQPFPTFALAGASRPEQVLALREAGDTVLTAAQRDGLRNFA